MSGGGGLRGSFIVRGIWQRGGWGRMRLINQSDQFPLRGLQRLCDANCPTSSTATVNTVQFSLQAGGMMQARQGHGMDMKRIRSPNAACPANYNSGPRSDACMQTLRRQVSTDGIHRRRFMLLRTETDRDSRNGEISPHVACDIITVV